MYQMSNAVDDRSKQSIALAHVGDESVARLIEVFLSSREHAFDVAEVNLRLAHGLPGSGTLDVDGLLRQLDQWTGLVALRVRNMQPHFEKSPGEYRNSRPYFQALVMATVLGRNLGARYRPELMADPVDWSDSRFLHGPMTGYGGTCASMPVLYVAIGRRLGWPLWLVRAKQHLFARWEDERDRLNIEATSHGLNCHPDEYYRQWPLPIEQNEIDGGWLSRCSETGTPVRHVSREAVAHRGALLFWLSLPLLVDLAARGKCVVTRRRGSKKAPKKIPAFNRDALIRLRSTIAFCATFSSRLAVDFAR
jgi:hypothetical protein